MSDEDELIDSEIYGRHYRGVRRWLVERLKKLVSENKISTHDEIEDVLANRNKPFIDALRSEVEDDLNSHAAAYLAETSLPWNQEGCRRFCERNRPAADPHVTWRAVESFLKAWRRLKGYQEDQPFSEEHLGYLRESANRKEV